MNGFSGLAYRGKISLNLLFLFAMINIIGLFVRKSVVAYEIVFISFWFK